MSSTAAWGTVALKDHESRRQQSKRASETRWRGAESRRSDYRPPGHGHPLTSTPDYPDGFVVYLRLLEQYMQATGRRFPADSEKLPLLEEAGWYYVGAEKARLLREGKLSIEGPSLAIEQAA